MSESSADQTPSQCGLSVNARWEVCLRYLADRYFSDPHPDPDELYELLDGLGVTIEQIEALINTQVE